MSAYRWNNPPKMETSMTSSRPQMTPVQQQIAQKWAEKRRAWFNSNPTREFQSVPLTMTELQAIAGSGYVVAAFDAPPAPPGTVAPMRLRGEQLAVVRRSTGPEGFSVLLMPKAPSRFDPPAGREDRILSALWAAGQLAAAQGLSMRDFFGKIPEIANMKLPSLH